MSDAPRPLGLEPLWRGAVHHDPYPLCQPEVATWDERLLELFGPRTDPLIGTVREEHSRDVIAVHPRRSKSMYARCVHVLQKPT